MSLPARRVLRAMVFVALLPLVAQAGSPDDPPTDPKVVDDSSGKHGLVISVSGNGGNPADELERVTDIFNATIEEGVSITIYTNAANAGTLREAPREGARP